MYYIGVRNKSDQPLELLDLIAKIPPHLFYGWCTLLFIASCAGIPVKWLNQNVLEYVHFAIYFMTTFFIYTYLTRFTRSKKLLAVISVVIGAAIGAILGYMQTLLYPDIFLKDYIISSCLGAIIFGIVVIPKKPLTIYGRRV